MKKFVAIFLFCTYAASAMGLGFSLHYCHGHYKGTSLLGFSEDDCCGNKMEKKNGCCSNKELRAKSHDTHAPSHFSTILKQTGDFFTAPNFCNWFYSCIQPLANATFKQSHSPPLFSHTPVYLFIRVLRL
jgi:hypothetical protein